MLLENKVALITGGAGGIGRATAKLFLEHGANVLLTDLNDDDLQETADALGAGEDRLRTLACDVSSDEDNRRAVEAAKEHFGGLDILFANAGIEGVVRPLMEYPEDNWDLVQNVNVKGVWLGIKHAFPALIERGGGSVIITSSVAGLQGTARMVAYTTSKHATIGLMRVAALEGAPHKIRVNCVNPGPVDNRMMRSLEQGMGGDDAEAVKQGFTQMIPLGRYATDDDVAQAVLYYASDLSVYITGTIHPVDGGLSA